ncbi:MAG: LysM peptidoglycan-binding domain-containing protein [bacterium]|nr:LysM peptidoglycan-binding domain-containing protein [bacterium]
MDLKKLLKALKLNESSISTFLGGLVILVVLVLVVNYFRGRGEETTLPGSITATTSTQEGAQPKVALPAKHTVAQGEHLWGIAESYYGSGYNWVDVALANKLANPEKIEVGQELTIPDMPVKMATGQDVEKPTVATTTVFGPEITGDSYTVVKGDHLWGISVRAYADGYRWSEVVKVNNIKNPNRVDPGQVLTLPR